MKLLNTLLLIVLFLFSGNAVFPQNQKSVLIARNDSIQSLNRDIDNVLIRRIKRFRYLRINTRKRYRKRYYRPNRKYRKVSRRNRKTYKRVSYIKYIFRKGDTLYSLSRRYRVSVKWIIEVNNIKNPRDISIGTLIKIPRINNSSYARTRRIKVNRKKFRVSSKIPLFIYPVRGRLLSRFGYRRRSKFTRRYSFHPGIDLKGKIGTPIKASAPGIVVFSGYRRGYGKVVKIKHVNGFMTVYAHNKRNYVRKGQRVRRGQVIACIGMTGYTTGSHVHFEIRYKNKPKNPLLFLRKYVSYK